jgi:hypothetical protein
MSPEESTATHNEALEHEMPVRSENPMYDTVQADAPPVGLVEVIMFPALSTPTQRDALGHETLVRALWLSTTTKVQADAPPVGLVEVNTLPRLSTATQSDTFGHETPWKAPP